MSTAPGKRGYSVVGPRLSQKGGFVTGHTIPLGRIWGIPIDLDYSWFLVFGLLTWVLAVSYYPAEFKNRGTGEYWLIGAVTAILLFVSVLLHELGHSIVAIRYRIPVRRITLLIFGGVAQIGAEPPSAAAEFWIAIAGPGVSLGLAVFFTELSLFFPHVTPLLALTKYLALLNLLLALFNLIPGFPLDGGRVLRAIVWGVTRNFHRATIIAANVGRFFGFALIFVGVWQVLAGNLINGLWIAFIGWFLESAAGAQVQQHVARSPLVGHRVSEIMKREYPVIPTDLTLQELLDRHVLGTGQCCFVVGQDSQPVGLVTLHDLREVPRANWATTTAAQAMVPMARVLSVQPNAEVWTALEKMGRDGVSQLPVLSGGTIVGMLSRDDIAHYLRTLHAIAR